VYLPDFENGCIIAPALNLTCICGLAIKSRIAKYSFSQPLRVFDAFEDEYISCINVEGPVLDILVKVISYARSFFLFLYLVLLVFEFLNSS